MPPNAFSEPSLAFVEVMGLWNTRETVSSGTPDVVRVCEGKGKQNQREFHMRASTVAKKKSLLRASSSVPRRSSIEKWNSILHTTTQLVRAKNKLRANASRVKLHNIIAKKLTDAPFTPPVRKKTEKEIELIRDAIYNNFVFDDLSQDDLKLLIDAFAVVDFKEGDVIIKQGDQGDYFYIVKDGEARFYVDEEEVGIAPRGFSFGEVSLLYTCPQAATVLASADDTSVFRVDQVCFRHIVKARTQKLDNDKTSLLQAMGSFKDVDQDDLKRLSEAMVAVVYKEGDVLYDNDDGNPPFCVVQEGELMVTDLNIGATKYHQMKIGEGDHFGEQSLDLTDDAFFGTATALSNGLAFTIDRATFQKVFGKLSRLVMKSLDRKKLASIPVLAQAGLDDSQLDTLARNIEDKIYEGKGEIFSKDKEIEAALYLVREGHVKLIDADGTEKLIGPGDYFGEEQLMRYVNLAKRPGLSNAATVASVYLAESVETATLGVLALDVCRAVFDTRDMGPDTEDATALEEPDIVAEEYEKELTVPVRPTTSDSKLEDLTHHRLLGEGQFGEVWLVSSKLDKEEPEPMALKILDKDPFQPEACLSVQQEIGIMQELHHPFVVNLIASYEDAKCVYILMPAAPGGELFDVIYHYEDDRNEISGLEEKQARFYGAVITDALTYLHLRKIVYRDLKPENVLIDADGYPFLIDFGLAKQLPMNEDKTFTLCGTPQYTAPEIITNRGHGLSSDNWSLGILIYTLVEGANPFFFEGMNQKTLFHVICKGKHYPMSDEVSTEARNLVDRLLEKDPGKRLGSFRLKDVFAHPWFANVSLPDLRQKRVEAPWKPDALILE